jgi:hypothetical protein
MRAMRFWPVVLALLAFGCSSSDFEVVPPADGAAEVADMGEDTVADSATAQDTMGTDSGTVSSDASGDATDAMDGCKPGITCPSGQYCELTGCGATVGRCQPIVASTTYAPVCGCDSVTYWNRAHAQKSGVVVKGEGRCKDSDARGCVMGGSCGFADGRCVREIPDAATCATPPTMGICWRLPGDASCGAAPGPLVTSCAMPAMCITYCSAVRMNPVFYAMCTTPT